MNRLRTLTVVELRLELEALERLGLGDLKVGEWVELCQGTSLARAHEIARALDTVPGYRHRRKGDLEEPLG